jgi:hypothetical protein
LHPYAVSHDLSIALSEDPYDPTQEDLSLGTWRRDVEDDESIQFTIDFSSPEIRWRKIRISLEVSIPPSELKALMPSSSDPAKDAALVVSFQCPSTKLRLAVVLEPVGEAKWRGVVDITRESVKSSVRIQPRLVRKTTLPGAESGERRVARNRGEILADGRDLMIAVDPKPSKENEGPAILWEDFRQSTNPWRKEHSSDLFHLEPYGMKPKLYLNKRYTALKAALHSRGSEGTDAILRHLASGMIAQTVWVQLFNAAVGGAVYDPDSGSVEAPQEPWKADILANFLPRVFPETAEAERIGRARKALDSPDEAEALMSLVGTAAQETVGSFKLINAAVRAAEKLEE